MLENNAAEKDKQKQTEENLDKDAKAAILENIKHQIRVSMKHQKANLTYPMVPFSNEYVGEFKDRYTKELQWKKDEVEGLNKQYWEVQEELECHQRHHDAFCQMAEAEAHDHRVTHMKWLDAEKER